MEPSSLRHSINLVSGGVVTSHPISLPLPEYKFVQYLDTLIGSTDPQVRSLGRQARTEYLEEKKRFESIPITPLSILTSKSHDISTRL